MVVEPRESIAGLDVTLSDLRDCTVFLLGPLAALFMHRLQRCQVFAGPVAGAIFMEGGRGACCLCGWQEQACCVNGLRPGPCC